MYRVMILVAELSTWVGLSLLCSALLSRRWMLISTLVSVSAALACWAFVRLTRDSASNIEQIDVIATAAAGLGALLAAKGVNTLQQSARR